MRGTTGSNADERAATAHLAVETAYAEHHPDEALGLSEEIEELIGEVEANRRLMEALERRAGNAQSVLSTYRDGLRYERFVEPPR